MLIWSRSLETNHGDMWICSMMDVCFTVCYCFPVFLCEAEVYVPEIPDLTILGHRSVIFDCSSRFERTEMF